jgi:CheY-like chemotaxis protein
MIATTRTTDFQNLMRRQAGEILLVASPYDAFSLAQDGQLQEQMTSEFMDLNLRHVPGLTRVAHGTEALAKLRSDAQFDAIIATPHLGDMEALEFAWAVKEAAPGVPLILLAFDYRELRDLQTARASDLVERVFMWQGDFRILLAIVKYLEDRWNVAYDTAAAGVQVILLVEDDIRFYSSYLPMLFTEVMRQSERLIAESVNVYHRLLRMRARPKILLCDHFEEAANLYERYEDHILGVITDIEYPHNGQLDRNAGLEFAQLIRERRADVPVLLQSSRPNVSQLAQRVNARYAMKESATLLHDVRRFMEEHFGFGDFVFRMPDGTEVDRAPDMLTLEKKLHTIPAESIRYHAERDHFSSWLKARTEFELAESLKPRKVADYANLEALRQDLIDSIAEFRRERSRGFVADFRPDFFDPQSGFARIGGGSLGGKARGLAFANHVLHHENPWLERKDVCVTVPPSVVLCTDVFDRFLDQNQLREFVLQTEDENEILQRFLDAPLPRDVLGDLEALLKALTQPLAVRSSSLLEDSQFHPFAGIYDTFMLPNNRADLSVRLSQLIAAIQRVYASTYSARARRYMKATANRLEEEKMAVLIQPLVGALHDERFYPDVAGVARSHNFYPKPPMQSTDGVVSVALGFGKTIVEGGIALRFCPRYPRHLLQLGTTRDLLDYTQKTFFALDMNEGKQAPLSFADMGLKAFELGVAEQDGTLSNIASVYSPENDAIYEGLSRAGVRVVDFAPVLKQNLFPLAEIAQRVMDVATEGLSGPVEVEFAINLSTPNDAPKEFAILQVRPFVLSREIEELEIGDHALPSVLCRSSQVLGVGRVDGIRDIVMVDMETFDRGQSRRVAQQIGDFNTMLLEKNAPYLLIGVGRWGSSDPWLGIPVTWDQISGARVIVETGFKDFKVMPSEGAHFFQNLTAQHVGYFTINPDSGEGHLDWPWLHSLPATRETEFVKHIRLSGPLTVKMNGHRNQGVILKPGVTG